MNISCASGSAASRQSWRVWWRILGDPPRADCFWRFRPFSARAPTLIEKHERERKENKGLKGKERGKDAAALDAAGAGLGSVALAVFGAVVWLLATETAPGSLVLATIAWFAVAVLLWRVRRTMRVYHT